MGTNIIILVKVEFFYNFYQPPDLKMDEDMTLRAIGNFANDLLTGSRHVFITQIPC